MINQTKGMDLWSEWVTYIWSQITVDLLTKLMSHNMLLSMRIRNQDPWVQIPVQFSWIHPHSTCLIPSYPLVIGCLTLQAVNAGGERGTWKAWTGNVCSADLRSLRPPDGSVSETSAAASPSHAIACFGRQIINLQQVEWWNDGMVRIMEHKRMCVFNGSVVSLWWAWY